MMPGICVDLGTYRR